MECVANGGALAFGEAAIDFALFLLVLWLRAYSPPSPKLVRALHLGLVASLEIECRFADNARGRRVQAR